MKNLISKAISSLILDNPFYATILLSMTLIEDNSVKTMATNGNWIKYNKSWVDSLSLPEIIFVMAHEALHVMLMHMTRRGSRNPNRFNIAADYVINDLLTNDKIGVMPKGGLHDPQLVIKGGGTAEGVYNLLPDDCDNNAPGSKGGSLDDCQDASQGDPANAPGPYLDPSEISKIEQDILVRIIQASNAANMRGKLSGQLKGLIAEMTKPQNDWREILRKFITEKSKTDFSFARPKRKFLSEDIILPSLIGEKLGPIIVAVDCSGSIHQKLLADFSSEINCILQDTRPAEIKIIYFDSRVIDIETIADDSEVKLRNLGGGGTAFSPIFEAIKNLDNCDPAALVVLTDLDCGDFGPVPHYPVLWASNKCDTAPFGEIVMIKAGQL